VVSVHRDGLRYKYHLAIRDEELFLVVRYRSVWWLIVQAILTNKTHIQDLKGYTPQAKNDPEGEVFQVSRVFQSEDEGGNKHNATKASDRLVISSC
jgi:hypothetical protein